MSGLEYIHYNEACADCGIPACLHLGEGAPPIDSHHTVWGDLNPSRHAFKRCDPPRAAYGRLPGELGPGDRGLM